MNVLIVDDSAKDLGAAGERLKALGHEVTLTTSYAEARALLERGAFDVVLLDLFGSKSRKKYFEVKFWIAFRLVLCATRFAKCVGFATDVSDLDCRPAFMLNGAIVLIMRMPMTGESKDWVLMFKRVLDASSS